MQVIFDTLLIQMNTMMVFYPGSCIIQGYAFLEWPCFQLNAINSFILDTAIAGSLYTSINHILYGTVQINEQLLHHFIDARVYTIEAKACAPFIHRI